MEAIEFLKEHMNEFCDFADTYMLDWYKDLLDDNEDEWLREEGKPKSDEEIFKMLEDRMENNYLIGGYLFCALDFSMKKELDFIKLH